MKFFCSLVFAICVFHVSAQEASKLQNEENTEIPGFKLYPNPAFDDVIYITSTLNAPKEVIIYDVFGKAVLRNNLHTTPLDISHLDSGVYVLQVTEEKKTSTRKLVIK